MEKISVLMPVYNREAFLERSINSIRNQTYKNLAILIYDDGSTDNSLDIIKKLQKEDSRIVYISNVKNMGVGHARNVLLDMCDTKRACWMDSDDISDPERIDYQVNSPASNKSLIFCTWENLKSKKAGTTLGFATLLFPVIKEIRFNEKMLWGGEDWDWISRMRIVCDEHVVEKVLYSIDFHGNRIGTWKRKIDKEWGGKYDLQDIEDLTYEEAINKFKKENL